MDKSKDTLLEELEKFEEYKVSLRDFKFNDPNDDLERIKKYNIFLKKIIDDYKSIPDQLKTVLEKKKSDMSKSLKDSYALKLTSDEEKLYRMTLSFIFQNARDNVSIEKEFLRQYYKHTKVKVNTKSSCDYGISSGGITLGSSSSSGGIFTSIGKTSNGVFISNCGGGITLGSNGSGGDIVDNGLIEKGSIKEVKVISYELHPEFQSIIDIVLENTAKKVYQRFVEGLEYFITNGCIKIEDVNDYLVDVDDYIVTSGVAAVTSGVAAVTSGVAAASTHGAVTPVAVDSAEFKGKDFIFKHKKSEMGYFTEYHTYKKSKYPISIHNYGAECLNYHYKNNKTLLEKITKLHSDALEKFKKEFIDNFKDSLCVFKYDEGSKKLLMSCLKSKKSFKSFFEKSRPNVSDIYKNCGLNLAAKYLMDVNKDIIYKRNEIESELEAIENELARL